MHILRSFQRHFVIYFIVNLIGFFLFTFFRKAIISFECEVPIVLKFVQYFGEFTTYAILIVIPAFLMALFSSAIDIFILKPLHLKLHLGLVTLIELIAQATATLVMLQILENMFNIFLNLSNMDFSFDFSSNIRNTFWVLAIASIVLAKIFIEIDRKLGHGNIFKMFLGRFHNPKEEERLFMFIDLKGSTSIAEQLGHLKFSKLLQACFNDLIVVDKYRAEVYQYVGDEVVLSWSQKRAFKNNNYLKAYFGFQARLKSKKEEFINQFGIEPVFKAGVHFGQIVTTEVGMLKREISYHGDTINTTARIQGKCNELGAQLLISEATLKRTIDRSEFTFTDKGLMQLKGKQNEVRVFKVENI